MIGFIIIVCVIAFIIEVKSEKEKEKVKQINDELSARENRIYDKDKYEMKNPQEIPEYLSFIRKNAKIMKHKMLANEEFSWHIEYYVNEKIWEKHDQLYIKQLCNVLTHTVRDKDLKSQIITEIKNSKYCKYMSNDVQDEYIILNNWSIYKWLDDSIFANIKKVVLQYLDVNSSKKTELLDKLHYVGQKNSNDDNLWLFRRYIGDETSIYDMLEYLTDKKIMSIERAEQYKDILSKGNASESLYEDVGYEYAHNIITNGDVEDYIFLSNKIMSLLFRVDEPGTLLYAPRSDKESLAARKLMLDARYKGLNPLLLFKSNDFENSHYFIKPGMAIKIWNVLQLKFSIDCILSTYFPVLDFLDHAKEISDAYITGSSFIKDILEQKTITRSLFDIQLQALSPYELFGFTAGYLCTSFDLEKRCPVEYIKKYIRHEHIKDEDMVKYLEAIDNEIFDKNWEYYWNYIRILEKQNSLAFVISDHNYKPEKPTFIQSVLFESDK